MQAELIQHPVGQGGMYSGKLDCGARPVRWVYDCGSNQSRELQRELGHVAADGPVDILFLSHLDSDHVSGVDLLLAATEVTEVVLPYLSRVDLTLTISRDVEAGTLNGTFLEFATNPAGWFISRGVQNVTFVDGRADDSPPDDGADGPGGPTEGGGGGADDLGYKWSRSPSGTHKTKGATVQRMDTNAVVQVSSARGWIDWVLAPYAHRPSNARTLDFRKALKIVGFQGMSMKKIADQARTSAGREKLRECYDALWSNHNLVSMSLYAGPEKQIPNSWTSWNNPSEHHFWHAQSSEIGWLATGDAYLASNVRRSALLTHYKRYLAQVGTFIVPHHGASTYFHRDLVDAFPSLRLGVAAAGRNGYGHPHKEVRDAVRRRCPFLRVGENPASALRVQAEF